ncbi:MULTISPECIES: helix-turn-helix domain-containing protein [Methylobacter]
MIPKQDNKSTIKVFSVLDLLLLNFATGLTQTEIIKSTGLNKTLVHRYVKTLIDVGYVEEINDTKRYRPSPRFAQFAVQILNSLHTAEKQLAELNQRISRK